jgi:hypothetical protein
VDEQKYEATREVPLLATASTLCTAPWSFCSYRK